MSTAQDLRTAAINNTRMYHTDWKCAEAHLLFGDGYTCHLNNTTERVFLLIVAEALDYREPMSHTDATKIRFSNKGFDILRATEAYHGIGA